jgi:hypothetical protein
MNVVLGVGISWASVRSHSTVPPWGVPWKPSIFWNILGTLFLLPMLTCVLVTPAIRRDVRAGSLGSLSKLRVEHNWLMALPAPGWHRGMLFGLLAMAALAPPAILLLIATGSPDLTSEEFIVSQTVLAVALGAVFTPLIALYAMADHSPGGPMDLQEE